MRRWLAAASVLIFQALPANAQQLALATPDEFVPLLERASEFGPYDPVWFYIAAVINGANTLNVLNTGNGLICGAPVSDDIEETTDTIMRFLVTNDLLASDSALFEIVVLLSHAQAYPCTADWNA